MRAFLYLLILSSTLAPACQSKQRAPVEQTALAPGLLLQRLAQLVARQTLTPDSLEQLTGNTSDYRVGELGARVLFVGWGDLQLRTEREPAKVSLEISALRPSPAVPSGQLVRPNPPVPSGQPGRWGRLPYTLPTLQALFGPWKEDRHMLTKDEDSRTYSVSFPYQDPHTGRQARVQVFLDSPDRSARAVIYRIDVTPVT